MTKLKKEIFKYATPVLTTVFTVPVLGVITEGLTGGAALTRTASLARRGEEVLVSRRRSVSAGIELTHLRDRRAFPSVQLQINRLERLRDNLHRFQQNTLARRCYESVLQQLDDFLPHAQQKFEKLHRFGIESEYDLLTTPPKSVRFPYTQAELRKIFRFPRGEPLPQGDFSKYGFIDRVIRGQLHDVLKTEPNLKRFHDLSLIHPPEEEDFFPLHRLHRTRIHGRMRFSEHQHPYQMVRGQLRYDPYYEVRIDGAYPIHWDYLDLRSETYSMFQELETSQHTISYLESLQH